MDDHGHPHLGLEELAGLVVGYRWFEHQLFELAGSWAASAEAPVVQVHLDEVSLQHAWHADLWADRMPVVNREDADRSVPSPAPTYGALVSAMAELTAGAPGPLDVHRLAALYRVAVPRLLAAYDRHLRLAVPVSDRPVIRALRLAIRDELESWQVGEALLQSLLIGLAEVEAAADTQRRLESVLVEASLGLAGGAGEGLVAWPSGGGRADASGPDDSGGGDLPRPDGRTS